MLFDLRAAFGTIDHSIWIDRLESRFGVTGDALQWFRTYFKDRSTRVMINHAMSRHHIFNYSVPLGSVVGPQAFIMYIQLVIFSDLAHTIDFHTYAYDTQLYCEFSPKIPCDLERVLGEFDSCISQINTWMYQNKLQN